MKNELKDKEISLNKYKERLNTLSNTYEKEIQELKKDLKKSKEYIDIDKKDEAMKKFSELSKEQQKHIKVKETIEQELNEKEQELNKKEQELANNKTKNN